MTAVKKQKWIEIVPAMQWRSGDWVIKAQRFGYPVHGRGSVRYELVRGGLMRFFSSISDAKRHAKENE
jgi:hypothetical protein